MKNSVELDARVQTIRIYGHNADNPEAVAQISIYGDRAYLWSIKGERFWQRADAIAEKVLPLGVERLEGYITPSHARLVRMTLGKLGYFYKIEPKKFVKQYQREMCWGTWHLIKDSTYKGGELDE